MSALKIDLLGRFVAHLDGDLMPGFRTIKVQALLIYLVVESEAHSRESLLELLWPGMPERSARHNLRQIIYHLRSAIPDLGAKGDGQSGANIPLLLANRQSVQINPAADITVDVVLLEKVLNSTQSHDHLELFTCKTCSKRLEQAVDLYQGDFLADFYLDDSNEFEDWAQARRETYRRQVLDALEILTTMRLREKEFVQAEAYARHQLDGHGLYLWSYLGGNVL